MQPTMVEVQHQALPPRRAPEAPAPVELPPVNTFQNEGPGTSETTSNANQTSKNANAEGGTTILFALKLFLQRIRFFSFVCRYCREIGRGCSTCRSTSGARTYHGHTTIDGEIGTDQSRKSISTWNIGRILSNESSSLHGFRVIRWTLSFILFSSESNLCTE